MLQMLHRFQIYVVLLPLFPILFIFTHNRDEVVYLNLFLPLIIVIIISLVVYAFLKVVTKDSNKAGVLTVLFLACFFLFGHVYELVLPLLERWSLSLGVSLDRDRYLLVVWFILFAVASYLIVRAKNKLESKTFVFNIVSIVLVAMSLVGLLRYEFKVAFSNRDPVDEVTHVDIDGSNFVDEHGALPDIYYLILDGYAHSETLEKLYDHDNKDFTGYLEEQGFHVEQNSTSNYTLSLLTLASALNMKYVNYLVEEYGGDDDKIANELSKMIQDNEVVKQLKAQGYSTAHFSSGWGPTDYNPHADSNFRIGKFSPFSVQVLKTTLLRPFYRKYFAENSRREILYSFEQLATVPDIEGPTFAFAHIMAPHPPYVFDEACNEVSEVEHELYGDVWQDKESYTKQLVCINKKTKEFVQSILSKDENAVIILQSDHGPSSLAEWEEPSRAFLEERMRNFSAYRFPQVEVGEYAKTPVNTFRMVLKYYFDADLDFLPEKNYYSNYEANYDFTDVTEAVSR